MEELAKWDNFYVIVGSAAGALIGLQFVVLTLIADRPSTGSAEAGAAFASPTIVHFTTALLLSALLQVPWEHFSIIVVLWSFIGLCGVLYTLIIVRRMHRQSAYKPMFEDWVFHVALPFIAYAGRADSFHHVHNVGSFIRRRRRNVAVALYRHPQRLGRYFVSCARRQD